MSTNQYRVHIILLLIVLFILGLILSVWLFCQCAFCLWLNAHPSYDDQLWAHRFYMYFFALIITCLLQMLTIYFVYKTIKSKPSHTISN